MLADHSVALREIAERTGNTISFVRYCARRLREVGVERFLETSKQRCPSHHLLRGRAAEFVKGRLADTSSGHPSIWGLLAELSTRYGIVMTERGLRSALRRLGLTLRHRRWDPATRNTTPSALKKRTVRQQTFGFLPQTRTPNTPLARPRAKALSTEARTDPQIPREKSGPRNMEFDFGQE